MASWTPLLQDLCNSTPWRPSSPSHCLCPSGQNLPLQVPGQGAVAFAFHQGVLWAPASLGLLIPYSGLILAGPR